MAEKPKPKQQEKPADIMSVRNGMIKDKPLIDKTAIAPPSANFKT